MSAGEPTVLVVWGKYPLWFPPPQFSSVQVNLAAKIDLADMPKEQSVREFAYFQPPQVHGWLDPGRFDLVERCGQLGLPKTYDLIVVMAEQGTSIYPLNTHSFACPTVLLLGDTHHSSAPISTMIGYARAERFDLVLSQFNGQHVHWFLEAGIDGCGFLPGLLTRRHAVPWRDDRRDQVVFVGHSWAYDVYRRELLDEIKQSGLPSEIKIAAGNEAAKAYAEALISFNCSMNGDLNMRNFEVLASGGFLLADALSPASGFPELFEPGKACDVYHGRAELFDKIDFYRRHPATALRMARRGLELFEARLSPERAMAALKGVVFGGKDAASLLPQDPRCRNPDNETLDRRLMTYEAVQELHRKKPRPRVLLTAGADWFRPRDVADLPRLGLYSLAQEARQGCVPVGPETIAAITWDRVI